MSSMNMMPITIKINSIDLCYGGLEEMITLMEKISNNRDVNPIDN